MLFLSVVLYLLASLGVMAMGVKYIRAILPLDYHAEITKGTELSPETLRVFGALYKVMGGAILALGFVMVMLTLFGVWNDLIWAKLTLFIGTLIAGAFTTLVPRQVESETGVRTPWRIAAGLCGIATVAFLISLI